MFYIEWVDKMLEMIKNVHDSFWTSSVYFIIYIVCMLILILRKKQFHKGNTILVGYSLLILFAIIYNPIFAKISLKFFFNGNEEYVRIFQILPVWYTIAYVFSTELSRIKGLFKYVLLGILVLFLTIFGKTVYQQEWYLKADNIYKINEDALEVSNIILDDMQGKQSIAMVQGKENQYIRGGSFFYGIRQYTADLILIDDFPTKELYDTWSIQEKEEYLNNNREYLKREKRTCEYQYIIIEENQLMIRDMENCGYSVLGKSGKYIVMKV